MRVITRILSSENRTSVYAGDDAACGHFLSDASLRELDAIMVVRIAVISARIATLRAAACQDLHVGARIFILHGNSSNDSIVLNVEHDQEIQMTCSTP